MQADQPASPPIAILSVEDHPVFREGLGTIISAQPDMRLVAQASTAEDGLAAFHRHHPDVTLLDLRLDGADGLDVLAAILRDAPAARVIILTTSEADGEIRRALRVGASGYVLKSGPVAELLAAVRAVHRGERVIPRDVATRLAAHYGDDDPTARELEVLALIRDGLRNKQVADRLGIAESTVNFHIRNVVEKLGANDRTHAVAVAIRRGLLSA